MQSVVHITGKSNVIVLPLPMLPGQMDDDYSSFPPYIYMSAMNIYIIVINIRDMHFWHLEMWTEPYKTLPKWCQKRHRPNGIWILQKYGPSLVDVTWLAPMSGIPDRNCCKIFLPFGDIVWCHERPVELFLYPIRTMMITPYIYYL